MKGNKHGRNLSKKESGNKNEFPQRQWIAIGWLQLICILVHNLHIVQGPSTCNFIF